MTVTLGHFNAEETKLAQQLGPWGGRYTPNHKIIVYREGDPKRPVKQSELDLGSIISINTSKNINEIAGKFTITLKDGRALYALHPMDVILIWLKGHNQPLGPIMHGLISTVMPTGSADTEGGEESVTITGACMGKYLQVNMFFLPVWNPESTLPTVLVYGIGGVRNTALTPREIFRRVYREYIVGIKNIPGVAGMPSAQHWLDSTSRFEKIKSADGKLFKVPYVQFSEEATEAALTRLEITGFSEAWVDEVGRVVYRRPTWDQPVAWVLSAKELLDWHLPTADEGLATYVEVVPTGTPLSGGQAEALIAGRAPIPSSYVASLKSSGKQGEEGQQFSPEFIIDTYTKNSDGHRIGEVTSKGERNYWYRMMRRWGMRPMQIESPLLVTGRQAQEQAQGLLRFFSRKTKTGTITIPGEPNVRLGTNILLQGTLRGQRIERAFYIEGVEHDYLEENEGGHYQTTLTLAHGRDPHDAHFPPLNLETPSGQVISKLSKGSSVNPGETNSEDQPYAPGSELAKALPGGRAMIPGEAPEAVRNMITAGNQIAGKTYVYGASHGVSLADLNPATADFDCSSATCFILYKGGFLPEGYAKDSTELESIFQEGTGKWITVHANAVHTFIVVAGAVFNTWNPTDGNGLGWYAAPASSISAIEAHVGPMVKRHPNGY